MRLNVSRTLGLVAPPGLCRIVGPLSERDVVVANPFINQALRIGRDLFVPLHRVRRQERRNDMRIAAL